jgi:hypothetical protein
MKTPHKYCELIKAWADGAEIEARQGSSTTWVTVDSPTWSIHGTYRIKPEPKPDAVVVWYVDAMCWQFRCDNGNLKLTFDGETRKLKSAEVIS